MAIAKSPLTESQAERRLPVGWRWVRFGDVVRSTKVNVDAATAGLERYVAGEHMSTDDLHIRSWGKVGNGYLGPAFHRRFAKGQVLYGSRRTYLRKVAVANFDGICANTTLVLEPSSDDLLASLLPFVMQTESFHAHSIRESKGSVNPYVNWSDLAWYQFALPPCRVQKRIAKLLWTADEQLQKWTNAFACGVEVRASLVRHFLSSADANTWQQRPCESVLSNGPQNGYSPSVNVAGRGAPTLTLSAIRDGKVRAPGNLKFAEISDQDLDKFRLREKDLLVVRGNGNRSLVGACGIVDEVPENCFFPDLMIRLIVDEEQIRPEFLCLQWNQAEVHQRLLAGAKSSNGIWKVNGQDVRKHTLLVPPIAEQDALIELANRASNAIDQLSHRVRQSARLRAAALESLLVERRLSV